MNLDYSEKFAYVTMGIALLIMSFTMLGLLTTAVHDKFFIENPPTISCEMMQPEMLQSCNVCEFQDKLPK